MWPSNRASAQSGLSNSFRHWPINAGRIVRKAYVTEGGKHSRFQVPSVLVEGFWLALVKALCGAGEIARPTHLFGLQPMSAVTACRSGHAVGVGLKYPGRKTGLSVGLVDGAHHYQVESI